MSSKRGLVPRLETFLVLQSLPCLPYEPLKLSSNKYLNWNTCFLLALTSAKRVSELHGLSFCVWHLLGWRSCSFSFFPDFVAKTQNLSLPDPRFEVFSVLALDDFVGGDQDELLLCPIRLLQKYLTCMKQYCPGVPSLFISAGRKKKQVS